MGGLTVLAVVVVAYTLVASKLDRWWITGPMVFAAAGAVLGPGGLDVLPLSLTSEAVLTITELTLALLLFSDASTVRLRDVEGDAGLPPETVQLPLIQAVVNALTRHGESPSTGHSAVRTARVIDGLLSDYRDSYGVKLLSGEASQAGSAKPSRFAREQK
jgi:sodium/hydrogen antiporter